MELRQLNYFIAISDAKSFTRAAEKLYVSQPALTGQINALENELGMKLFEQIRTAHSGGRGFLQARDSGAVRGGEYTQPCADHSSKRTEHTLLFRPSDFLRESFSGDLPGGSAPFPEPASSV